MVHVYDGNYNDAKLPQIFSLTTCVSVRSSLTPSEHVNRSASRSVGVSTGLLSIVAGRIPYSPRLERQDWIEGRGSYAEWLRVSTTVVADAVLTSTTCMWLWFYS